MTRKRKSKVHLKPEIGIYCEGESEKQYFTMLNQKYRASNIKTKRVKIDSIGESGIRLIEAARKNQIIFIKNKSMLFLTEMKKLMMSC